MKRKFIIFPALLLIVNLGFAQYRNYSTYFISRMGISVGGALSATSIENLRPNSDGLTTPTSKTKVKPGFSIMLTSEEDLSDAVKLRADAGYVQSGFRYSHFNTTYKYTSHDVYLNTGLKIKPLDFGPFSPYIYAGVNMRVSVASDSKAKPEPDWEYIPFTNDFNNHSLGWNAAIGTEYNDLFFFEFGYSSSFLHFATDDNQKFRSSFFGLTAGVYFLR